MKNIRIILMIVMALVALAKGYAQEKTDKPAVIYGQPRTVEIGGMKVVGVSNIEDYALLSI